MSVDIATYVHDLAVAAKAASASLATASDEQRQEAVRAMAAARRNGVDSIVAANELDMSAARDAGTSAGLLDRLLLCGAEPSAVRHAKSSASFVVTPDFLLENRHATR